jgi:hypothetical protein
MITNRFEPTIRIDEFSLESKDVYGKNEEDVKISQSIIKLIGDAFPAIKINDRIIDYYEIEYFELNCENKIPTITLLLNFQADKTFAFKDVPKDGDLLNLFIASKSDKLKPIRNDYVIRDVQIIGSDNSFIFSKMFVKITGDIYIPKFYEPITKSIKDTSFNALQKIAKEIELGFNSNVENTNDKQIWIAPSVSYYEYINNICDHAYKDDKSFFTWFIDIYYNINFVEVNKEITDFDKNKIFKQITQNSDFFSINFDEKIKKGITDKILSNHPNISNKNNYISDYNLINNTRNIIDIVGYRWYNNLYEHDNVKFWNIFTEPLITEGAEKEKILLRGRPKDDSYKINYKNEWMGIQYSLPNHNVHKNYLISKTINKMNNLELEKMYINCVINKLNLNFIKYENIPIVLFITKNSQNSEIIKTEKEKEELKKENIDPQDVGTLNRFYSGNYIMTGFKIIYEKITGASIDSNDAQSYLMNNSGFKQIFKLSRREWNIWKDNKI